MAGACSFCGNLSYAAMLSHAACVKTLIAAGADVNQKDGTGFTPLMWAVFCGHQAVVQTLIDAGADVGKKRALGHNALWWAKYRRDPEIEKILKDAPGKRKRAEEARLRQKELTTAFAAAVSRGDCDEVRKHFDEAFWEGRPPAIRWEDVQTALQNRDTNMLRLLIAWGAAVPEEIWPCMTRQEKELMELCGLPAPPEEKESLKQNGQPASPDPNIVLARALNKYYGLKIKHFP